MPPHASSVSQARALLREALAGADDALLDNAQLAVSEVVTNALVHAGTEVHLQAWLDDARLRVEVADGSPHLPAVRDYSVASGTGRGLHMVDQSVDAWGSYPSTGGKVVWFEIRSGTDGNGSSPVVRQQEPARAAGSTTSVVLLNAPLLMHLAWQEHAAALLREFLLVDLDGDEVAAFVRHASASEVLTLLHEQVPAPELLDDPEAIMTKAVEPRVSAERLVVEVPLATVDDFEMVNELLAEATALAATGALLVPPTQPEIAAMRRWICEQVRTQTRDGAEPRPWSSHIGERTPRPIGEWDPVEVSESERALLAMDEAGVIVAVSRSAAALLGYADGEQLRWQPLLSIVPSRYHQAHVAGTTLHMINGRAPLLGKRISVPVVRADGSEIEVDLEVQPRRPMEGRHVFLAEFFDAP